MPTGIGAGIAGQVFTEPRGVAAAICPTTYSCSYDGVTESQLASGDINFGTSSWSLSFWFKTPDTTGGGVNQRIIGSYTGPTSWAIYFQGSGVAVGRLQWVSTGTGNWFDNFQTFTPANNTWYHVVYSVDRSGNATWYYNGANPNAFDISSNTISFDGLGDLWIARNPTGQYFEGNLTEVSIWNKALTAGEVLELYNNMAGDEKCLGDLSMGANLTNWWRMFNPSGTYVDPMPNSASGGTITLTNNNMDATNVSTDVP